MVDDEKRTEECKNCECCKLVGKFFFLSGAVFLGTLMALLLAHSLTKPEFPKCHKGMMRPHHPGIERQVPPVAEAEQGKLPMNIEGKLPPKGEFRGHRGLDHEGAMRPNWPIRHKAPQVK